MLPPADIQDAAARAEFGALRDVFRPIDPLLFLGALGGAFFVVASVGLGIAALVLGGQGRLSAEVLFGCGSLPLGVLFGWATARDCWARIGGRVFLYEGGFVCQRRGDFSVFPWARIARVIHDDPSTERCRSGFPRVRRATAFTVFRDDDATFTFSLYSVRRHFVLARAVFDATRPLGVEW